MYEPLVNGLTHDWATITVGIEGVPVIGITGVKYEEKQERQDNYGAGDRPVSRGSGRITCTASLMLASEEILALQRSAPNKRLQEFVPFDITISYIPASSTIITTDIIKNCQFLDNKRDVKEGDMKVESELELICSHIEWDV